ncbi:10355_t:CDS:1, partial [Paraglomus brasilianum]
YEDNKGNEKSVTLDISQEISKKLELSVEEEFYVAEELLNQKEIEGGITLENEGDIFLQRHLIQEETNKGKIAGTAGGVGAGALGGAALGAGAMAALAP